MPAQNPILLQTKLHRPHLPRDLIVRERLVELLDQDIDRQLVLVCAPAGFGKTTLIGTWLERMAARPGEMAASLPSAWLSLDENESDLNLFLRYFIAALRTIFSEACAETLALIQARLQPPLEVLCATLSNEIVQLSESFILVLDDYHTIRGTEVHNLLSELARHWPKPLHLVLISRISPPIPLDNLRAKGKTSEIRTRDLRFTPEETAAYLEQMELTFPSQNALPLLEERFEGWPAGLHLAALSLRSASSQNAVLSALSSDNTNITSYLMGEVLTRQFPAIQTFLLKTSILDRFCVSLSEAVIGEIDPAWDAHACLDWINRSELFVIPLDDRREWYRYHHLFQGLLLQRLSAEMSADQVNELHCRATAWFEGQGLVEEAVQHALAAGDMELVAHQMNAGLLDVLNREDRPTLERWLRLLPEELIQDYPGLLMVRVWALQFTWQLDQQAHVLLQVEELLNSSSGASLPADERQILCAQILTVKAQQAYLNNQDTRAIDLCQQVLALLPPSWRYVHGGAMFYLGLSMQASGQEKAAEKMLLEEYESCDDKTNVFAMILLQSLGFCYLNSSLLEKTKQIGQLLIQEAIRGGLALIENWGDWFLGVVYYQQNKLDAAAQHFTRIIDNRFKTHISAFRDAVAGMALIHQINGESEEAWRMFESISQFDLEQRGSEDERTRALRARLLLMQGDLEGAGNWADDITDLPADRPFLWLKEPQFTKVNILIARDTDADLRQANQILDVLDEIAGRTHNARCKIEILALRAMALDAQEASSAAIEALKQAVDLAGPAGFVRVFVDCGKSMQTMLKQLAKQDYAEETIRRILGAFPREDKKLHDSESSTQQAPQHSRTNLSLAESLTPRELDILTLLREPISIKEIALRSNISYATAKRHTINIYSKLGVNQRWKAVARAQELKFLPPR